MEFSLGMGPAIFSKKFKKDPETTYSLRCLPIGGYVAMAGEIEGDEKEKELNIPYERTINGIKAWKRAIIVVAGVTFNFIFALILIAIYIFGNGVNSNDNRVLISNNSIAFNAGLRNSDKIVSVTSNIIKDGENNIIYSSCLEQSCSINTISDLVKIINEKSPNEAGKTQEITINYYHGDEMKIASLTRKYDDKTKSAQVLGVSAYLVTPDFFEGISMTFKTFGEIIVLMFEAIGSLFTKEGLNQVGGPVQVYSVSAEMAGQGVLAYIWFLAIISVNLGFFNLLPIPGLDGARFYISIGETITKKKFNTKIESYINMAGMFFLFGLMILVTIKDIFGLF
jgi:regulator of sigma E protease